MAKEITAIEILIVQFIDLATITRRSDSSIESLAVEGLYRFLVLVGSLCWYVYIKVLFDDPSSVCSSVLSTTNHYSRIDLGREAKFNKAVLT